MNKEQRLEILARAQRKAKRLKRLKKDERYHNVLGRLAYEGLLDVQGVQKRNYKLHLDDLLWVGENIEPRVLEVLPAILIKKPSMVYKTVLPEDLKQAKNKIRRGELSGELRGVPVKKCEQWLPSTGRRGQYPSVMKSFRFHQDDLKILQDFSKQQGITVTEALREAIRKLKV